MPDLMDFLNYCVYNGDYKHEFLGAELDDAPPRRSSAWTQFG